MNDLTWKSPPPIERLDRRRLKYADVADELRAHPGDWALLPAGPHDVNLARHIRSAHLAAFAPAGTFDTAVRRTESGSTLADVYVRYIGDTA